MMGTPISDVLLKENEWTQLNNRWIKKDKSVHSIFGIWKKDGKIVKYMEQLTNPDLNEKRYTPSFAELVDRLSIITQKIVYAENDKMKEAFIKERGDIVHDIDLFLAEGVKVDGKILEAVMVLQLVNSHIWENESAFRGDGDNADLVKTHQLNSDRGEIKKFIQQSSGGRIDYKLNYGLGIWKYPF